MGIFDAIYDFFNGGVPSGDYSNRKYKPGDIITPYGWEGKWEVIKYERGAYLIRNTKTGKECRYDNEVGFS